MAITLGTNSNTLTREHAGEVLYAGLVISACMEHNYYDDSDFYALVWDGVKPVEYPTWSTRGSSQGCPVAVADATPEILEAYAAYQQAERDARYAATQAERDARYAATQAELDSKPSKGRTVIVARGRKVPQGTTGVVIWFGEGKSYGYSRTAAPMRVGIRLADDSVVWTAAGNVDVVPAG
jgi:hypothetical protein